MSNDNRIPDELRPYKSRLTPRFFEVKNQLIKFLHDDILPHEKQYYENLKNHKLTDPQPQFMKSLREKAKQMNLHNLFLPEVSGLSNLEYAPIAELLGQHPLANEVLNCSAPDTGNMEILAKFGNDAQKQKWLKPLLEGEIRSAFAMTEPAVASSDPLNLQCSVKVDPSDSDYFIVSGHKWWTSGAIRPECKLLVVLARSSFPSSSSETVPKHKQLSMVLVPRDSVGVKILRGLSVFGVVHDHGEVIFDNVRVRKENAMLLGEGRGFEIAQVFSICSSIFQARLGPGRIHHCMRTVGVAEVALQSLIKRSLDKRKKAFGKLLASHEHIRHQVAEGRMELTKTRQLCYLAAALADDLGFAKAKAYVSMIKVAAPRMALEIVDNAMQVHGGAGFCQDSSF